MAGQGDPKKATAKAKGASAAAASASTGPTEVTAGPALDAFTGGDTESFKRYIDILNAAGITGTDRADLLKKYQLSALYANGDKEKIAGITDALQGDVMNTMANGGAGTMAGVSAKDYMAQMLAAQSIIAPLAQQSAERARAIAASNQGLMASYGQYLPESMRAANTNLAAQQGSMGNLMAEAYAQQAYAQPSLQAIAFAKQQEALRAQAAAQAAQNSGGSDFAATLASALGK